MASLTTPIPSQTSSEGRANLWQTLTTPAAGIPLSEQQKARLLLVVTLVFIPLSAITILVTPLSNFLNGQPFTLQPYLILVWLLGVSAYALGRTQYYQWGAIIIVALPYLAILSTALFSQSETFNTWVFFFMSISIIFGSLLLSMRETVIAGLAAVVCILLIDYLKTPTDNIVPVIAYFLVMTGPTALGSRIRDNYLHDLIVSQENLKEQIAETEAARERAERSDQVKSAFLASMSHELRTPLNAIINFTRYVAKGSLGALNTEQTDTLNEVVDSAKHLLNLINDVLDMSKIEAGSLKLFVEDNINVKPIVDSIVSTGKTLIAGKPVEIRVEYDETLPVIRGDRQRILQILLNIMSNACKFTEEGIITVQVSRAAENVVFAIADTGPGIAPEDQPAVFEAFKQTNTGLRQGGGTGLGMPISKNLTEAHGGRLWLDSSVGKGTTFFISLPIKSDLLVPSIVS